MAALYRSGISRPSAARPHVRECARPRHDFSEGYPRHSAHRRHPHRGHNYNKNQDIYRDHAERGWTGEVQLEAMDTEGIDTAVLFPTRGLGILTYPDHDPRFAAALARAYNDWLHDLCRTDPSRLLGAGMISVYDLDDAVEETRRVAEEYGFRSVFLRSNIVNGKNWYDPYYEPLWNTLEELNLPLGFHEARHPDRVRPPNISSPTSVSGAFTPSPSSK